MNSNQNNNNNNTNISKPRYPIKFGILRDSKTAIYFDRIRENPRWITSVIKLNPFEEIGYNSNNNGLTYKIFPYNILLMPAGGPNWNYINTRLDRLAKLAHANRDKTFQAFLNNPYLPLYPKYCNAEVVMFLFYFSSYFSDQIIYLVALSSYVFMCYSSPLSAAWMHSLLDSML